MRRQTPQGLVRELDPFAVGLVFGVDIGSLVSTYKTTSLIWIGLVGATLQSQEALVWCAAMLVVLPILNLGAGWARAIRGGLTTPQTIVPTRRRRSVGPLVAGIAFVVAVLAAV